MKRTLKYLIIIFLLATTPGCLKVIDFEEKDVKPLLVVNCFLTPGVETSLDLTNTVSALDDKEYFPSVNNANVTIDDGQTMFTDFEYSKGTDSIGKYNYEGQMIYEYYEKGRYNNKTAKIEGGKSYSIEISATGFETINAETTVPFIVPIEKIDTFTTYSTDQSYSYYNKNARIYFTDKLGESNYYRINVDQATISFTKTADDISIYPYYAENYTNSDDPVFGTNDTEDIFGGSSYNRFSIFDDKLFDGRNYGLKITLFADYKVSDPGYVSDYQNYSYNIYRVSLMALSPSMFLYLKTVGEQGNGSGSLFTEPVLIYSNVKNGAGVFGGFTSSVMYVSSHNLPNDMADYIPKGNSDEEMFNYIKELYKQYNTPDPENGYNNSK